MSLILEGVRLARNNPASYARDYYLTHLHVLAEAGYHPAIEFCISCLDDTRADWRECGLEALGYHYDLRPYKDILNKIAYLLLADPNDFVRMAAASVLGIRSEWPDKALLNALQTDSDYFVRATAFDALLGLAGVSHLKQMEIMDHLNGEAIPATLDLLKQTLTDLGIDIKFPDE
jgi:HEAT repeat protein